MVVCLLKLSKCFLALSIEIFGDTEEPPKEPNCLGIVAPTAGVGTEILFLHSALEPRRKIQAETEVFCFSLLGRCFCVLAATLLA